MKQLSRISPSLPLWLVIGAVAAAVILWTDTPYDIDDAPITYRYAENIAAGNGFVYNIGERILGTSTPLYTLLLALLKLGGITIPLASNVLNFVCSLATVILVMALTQEFTGSIGAGVLAVVYLLVQRPFLNYAMAGMETPFYTLLIVGVFWSFARGRYRWSATLAGLAFVTRLDGLGLVGAVLLTCCLQQRRLPWRALLIVLLVTLPWILFATWYFGSPLPLSMLAKQHHLQVNGASRYWIWQHLFVDGLGAPTYLLPFALLGVIAPYLIKRNNSLLLDTASLFLPSRQVLPILPLLWLLAYLVAYTLVGIDFYEWYLMPLYPTIAVFVATGFHFLLSPFWSAIEGKQSVGWRILGYLAVVVMLLVWFMPYAQYAIDAVNGQKEYLNQLERKRVQAGQWLKAAAPASSQLLTGAIGHIGYQSGFYIIDSAGLVTTAEQLRQPLYPDFYILGGAPEDQNCGPIRAFMTKFPPPAQGVLISQCPIVPYGTIGPLTLSAARIATWVHTPNGEWRKSSKTYLETQWLIDTALTNQAWTLFVHFTDAAGEKIAQSDHELGLQVDRTLLPLQTWKPQQRIYVYTEMPEGWEQQQEIIAAARVGLWNPATGEHLPIAPGRADVDQAGRLIIPIEDGEIQ